MPGAGRVGKNGEILLKGLKLSVIRWISFGDLIHGMLTDKTIKIALTGMSGLSVSLHTKGSLVQFPVRAHA